jgi:hypothetical protein
MVNAKKKVALESVPVGTWDEFVYLSAKGTCA